MAGRTDQPDPRGFLSATVKVLYLGWIDARETGLSDPAGFFMKEAGVKFNDGESFSAPGFIRVNFACPRAYLEEAFDKVEKALDNWKKQEKVY